MSLPPKENSPAFERDALQGPPALDFLSLPERSRTHVIYAESGGVVPQYLREFPADTRNPSFDDILMLAEHGLLLETEVLYNIDVEEKFEFADRKRQMTIGAGELTQFDVYAVSSTASELLRLHHCDPSEGLISWITEMLRPNHEVTVV